MNNEHKFYHKITGKQKDARCQTLSWDGRYLRLGAKCDLCFFPEGRAFLLLEKKKEQNKTTEQSNINNNTKTRTK